MPDNKVQFSGAQPGEGTGIPAPVEQAPQSGTPAPQNPEATTNQPVLDMNQVAELVRKAEEAAFNRARAYVDKKENVINKRVTEQLETLKALGFQPTPQQEQALAFYEVEYAVRNTLHNWKPNGFNRIMHRSTTKAERDDDIRERILLFDVSYTDEGAKTVTQLVARPEPVMGSDVLLPG